MAAEHIEITDKTNRDLLVLAVQGVNILMEGQEDVRDKMAQMHKKFDDSIDQNAKDIAVLQTKTATFITWKKMAAWLFAMLTAGGAVGGTVGTKIAQALGQTPPS